MLRVRSGVRGGAWFNFEGGGVVLMVWVYEGKQTNCDDIRGRKFGLSIRNQVEEKSNE